MGYIATRDRNLNVVKEKTYYSDDGKRRLCTIRVTYNKYEKLPYCGHVGRLGREVDAGRAKTKSEAWKKAHNRAEGMVSRNEKHIFSKPKRKVKFSGKRCKKCNGSGEVKLKHGGSWATCRKCGGEGKINKHACPDCGKFLTYCGIYGWFCEKCDHTTYDGHVSKHQRGECSGAESNQILADNQ